MSPKSVKRLLIALTLLAVGSALIYFLYFTPTGAQVRQDQREIREFARAWVEARPLTATLCFVLVYAVVGIFALPVWWVQVIGGYCFGLVNGVLLCHVGAILATLVTMKTSCWLLGDWFHQRIEPYHAKLRDFDEKLGHNGLLVVTAVRLCHVMPFGISNYLIGISKISLPNALLGTVLGGTFSKALHVSFGADPGLFYSLHFWLGMIAVNLLLLSPLLLRYLRPQWFARVGVE